MPNVLDANGLQTQTREELVTFFTAVYKNIYGDDIDLSSSSPDGQKMNIDIQTILDIQDLLAEIYSGFDPDNAVGKTLDQRVAINGIERQGGTFTLTPISITTDRALNLYGLDQTIQPVYTVADNAGNQWKLIATQTISGAGTSSFSFRSANPGMSLTVPNSIQTPITIVLGVTNINNPSIYSQLGENEESDPALKIRRQQSVAIPSQGFYDSIKAALGNTTGITSSCPYENYTDTTDSNGVPPHSIWVIVAGDALPADIAHVIYVERTDGCGMKGAQFFDVTRKDGTLFRIRWDNVELEVLYIKFTATSIDGINPPKYSEILTQLPSIYSPGVGAEVNINQLATFVQSIDPNCLITGAGFSLSPTGPFTNTLSVSAKNKQFTVLTQNITILPILLLPATAVLNTTDTQQFTAYGGTQTGFVYSILVNNSGASINASTGLYTAGATPGIDTVKVVDSDANQATSTVQVI